MYYFSTCYSLLLITVSDNLKAYFDKQPVWVHSSYGIASFEGEGTFSACDLKIVLDLELTVSAGSFGVAREVLTKN